MTGEGDLPLAQIAAVNAALAEPFPLAAVLAVEGLDADTWRGAEMAWRQQMAGDERLREDYQRELAHAEDRLARHVTPLEDDVTAWGSVLLALSTAASPEDVLEPLDLGVNDLSRLVRRWTPLLAADKGLRDKAEKLKKAGPKPLPKVKAEPRRLSASGVAPKKKREPAKAEVPEPEQGNDLEPLETAPVAPPQVQVAFPRPAAPPVTGTDPDAPSPWAGPSRPRPPRPRAASTVDISDLPKDVPLPFSNTKVAADVAIATAKQHSAATQRPALPSREAAGRTMDVGPLPAAERPLLPFPTKPAAERTVDISEVLAHGPVTPFATKPAADQTVEDGKASVTAPTTPPATKPADDRTVEDGKASAPTPTTPPTTKPTAARTMDVSEAIASGAVTPFVNKPASDAPEAETKTSVSTPEAPRASKRAAGQTMDVSQALASGAITPFASKPAAAQTVDVSQALASGAVTPFASKPAVAQTVDVSQALASGAVTPFASKPAAAQTVDVSQALASGAVTPFTAERAEPSAAYARAVAHAATVQGAPAAPQPAGRAGSTLDVSALFAGGVNPFQKAVPNVPKVAQEAKAVAPPAAPPSPAVAVPARPAPRPMTLEQYASLTVELQAYPDHRAGTLTRYQVSPETWHALEADWRVRLGADPALSAAFARACEAYRTYLAGHRR